MLCLGVCGLSLCSAGVAVSREDRHAHTHHNAIEVLTGRVGEFVTYGKLREGLCTLDLNALFGNLDLRCCNQQCGVGSRIESLHFGQRQKLSQRSILRVGKYDLLTAIECTQTILCRLDLDLEHTHRITSRSQLHLCTILFENITLACVQARAIYLGYTLGILCSLVGN